MESEKELLKLAEKYGWSRFSICENLPEKFIKNIKIKLIGEKFLFFKNCQKNL